MKKRLSIAISLLILLFIGFAFIAGRKERVSVDTKMFAQPASLPVASEEESLRSLGYNGGKDDQTVERKIIQSGSVTIEVKRYEPFFQALEQRIGVLNGYISNIQSQKNGELISSASVVVRVAPEKLPTLLSWLREQGRLTSEQIQAEDVSEQYYDLKARLENARHFEARLLEMLKTQTGKLQDLILVEEKLNQIREQIEQMEGKIRYFDALSSLATLTLQVQVESVYVVPRTPNFGERMLQAWKETTTAMLRTAQSLAVVTIMILPWILLLVVMFLTIRSYYRHIRRRNHKLAEAG